MKLSLYRRCLAVFCLLCAGWGTAHAQTYKFDFGPGRVAPGYTPATPADAYSPQRGYGFEPGAEVTCLDRGGKNPLRGDFCTGHKPFLFSVAVPEGNYNVTVTFGDAQGESVATVKAESRQLVVEKSQTAPGRFETRAFTVNVRNSKLPDGGTVKLKPRELGIYRWDDKLTLEFNNARPCVAALEITKTDKAVTVFLAGDSTVTDQTIEPWAAWGQMLPRFFKPGVALANHAESGETLRAFQGERRLDKILSQIKAGDYLFIQFGHNDQKEKGDGIGPFTSYHDSLKLFIAEARRHGAFPVLVTAMNRRTFDANGKITNSLGDYPAAVRQTAQEEKVPLIDLNAMSKTFYEALGPEKSVRAFVHYPAHTFPDQEQPLKDDTHFNAYGAYELARCIVSGIKANKLGLAKYLAGDTTDFDPARPDNVETWSLPASPFATLVKPAGS